MFRPVLTLCLVIDESKRPLKFTKTYKVKLSIFDTSIIHVHITHPGRVCIGVACVCFILVHQYAC